MWLFHFKTPQAEITTFVSYNIKIIRLGGKEKDSDKTSPKNNKPFIKNTQSCSIGRFLRSINYVLFSLSKYHIHLLFYILFEQIQQ